MLSTFQFLIKSYRQITYSFYANKVARSSAILALAGCGSGSGGNGQEKSSFPSYYVPPEPDYDPPSANDLYYNKLNVAYMEPYWVLSLQMDHYNAHILPMLDKYDNTIEYTFPSTQPDYDQFNVVGWQPATDKMKVAAREIFSTFNLATCLP